MPLLALWICVNEACDVWWFRPGPKCPHCGEHGGGVTVRLGP